MSGQSNKAEVEGKEHFLETFIKVFHPPVQKALPAYKNKHKHEYKNQDEDEDLPDYDSYDELAEASDTESDSVEEVRVGSISTMQKFMPDWRTYDFHLAKWLIETKTTKTGIKRCFEKGLYDGAGAYKSASSLSKVIKNIPTTLSTPSRTFSEMEVDAENFVLPIATQ
ncbi:hypothetical protein Q9L58_010277 [Maublancomyces gigas]|uniref:Uncharacterized protein n=1 Tax=Discina gigas TaxID=1032678 RepID=A0ABR3G4J7_9PEZI